MKIKKVYVCIVAEDDNAIINSATSYDLRDLADWRDSGITYEDAVKKINGENNG